MVIVLLEVPSYKPKGVLKSHNAAVTHMDWTTDGKHLQVCREMHRS